MNFMKRGILLLLVICMGLSAFSCAPTPSNPGEDDTSYTVMLVVPDGVTVQGDNPLTVEEGESATFALSFADKMTFTKSSAGVFDETTNTLTINNVTANMRVIVEAEAVEYDVNEDVQVLFGGTNPDTCTPVGKVKYGTVVTVSANREDVFFVGWELQNDDDRILSEERTFSFRVTPDVTTESAYGDYLQINPKYAELGTYYYDANGGVINSDTTCMRSTSYLKVTKSSAQRLTVRMSEKYLNYATCATAFWNDGTFTRDGFVLKEFNTKPDGTGDSYSPGSKFYPLGEKGADYVLYCIWEPYTASEFTYETISMSYPSTVGSNTSKAVHWRTSGVKITGYTGDAETVAIPDVLDGKPVIAIAKNAIKNKSVETLVLPRNIQRVEDGAIAGCSSLTTMYYPNSVYEISDACLDTASYTNFKTLVVCASMAPRYANKNVSEFSIKMCRLLSTMTRNRIIVIAGSSSLEGLSTPYLEALFDNEYAVVNFGTTRTTHAALYLEAIKAFTHEGDVVIFAPENSTYLMGDTDLYWKTLRDMDGMNNFFRYIDISNYTTVFSAFAAFNQGKGSASYYAQTPVVYEAICDQPGMNKYGDYYSETKEGYVGTTSAKYNSAYTVTLNEFYRNTNEGTWYQSGSQNDYTDSTYWSNISGEPYRTMLSHCVSEAKKGGAKVYFGFCPTDRDSLISQIDAKWMQDYDTMMRTGYGFDGLVGTVDKFIYNHQYFHNCAFHLNDYGRTWHTYNMYTHICAVLGKTVKHKAGDVGTNMEGCIFEKDAGGKVLESPKFQ